MTYYLTEKALRTCLVSGDCKIQSFDTRIAMEINIECAIFLHEIRSHDYQKNFDKKTHLLEKEDIESIINFLTYFFTRKKLEKSFKKLLKKSYIIELK